jgi:hypothetical protein
MVGGSPQGSYSGGPIGGPYTSGGRHCAPCVRQHSPQRPGLKGGCHRALPGPLLVAPAPRELLLPRQCQGGAPSAAPALVRMLLLTLPAKGDAHTCTPRLALKPILMYLQVLTLLLTPPTYSKSELRIQFQPFEISYPNEIRGTRFPTLVSMDATQESAVALRHLLEGR